MRFNQRKSIKNVKKVIWTLWFSPGQIFQGYLMLKIIEAIVNRINVRS